MSVQSLVFLQDKLSDEKVEIVQDKNLYAHVLNWVRALHFAPSACFPLILQYTRWRIYRGHGGPVPHPQLAGK